MHDLFVSYRRKDAASVDALVAALRDEGLSVWLDRTEIDDAASIQTRIDAGLAEARALLAWYSADYPKSRACQWELTAALIAAGAETAPVKRLLVVNPEADAEHVQPTEVRDLQHFAFGGDHADLARRVAEAIRPVVGTFGALRRLTKPRWCGAHGLGSNRFVGRVLDLWNIHNALSAGRFAIVSGLPAPRAAGELAQVRGSGGIGKSLLAEEYALRFGAWWPGGVFWLRAYGIGDDGSAADLAARREAAYGSQLFGFAQALGLETREKTDAQLRADIGRHLTEPYLWIVDDLPACGRDELERWLAPSSAGQTLVTTRSKRMDGVGAGIDLDTLPPADARALLTLGHPPRADEENDVVAILGYLDGYALALDVARSACRLLGYAGFRQRLEQPDRDALALAADLAGDLPNGHNPHIAATLLGSVRQLDEAGLDVLRLAVQLAAAPIPRELIAACLAEADGLAAMDAEDRAALGLRQLLDHSLAEEDDGPGGVTVHVLVARTLRYRDLENERLGRLRQAAIVVLNERMIDAQDIRRHASLASLLPHVQFLACDASDLVSLDLAKWLGWYESEGGRYRAGMIWFQTEYQARLAALGEEHQSTLASLGNLAGTLQTLGDLAGARAHRENVLEFHRRLLGEEHPDTLISLGNLALTLQLQGDLVGARAHQEKVLAIHRRVLGEYHLDTLTSLNNLALTLHAQGDLDGARAHQERASEVFQRELGEEHPTTLTSWNNLASTLQAQGDLNGARVLQEKVLAIHCRVLGEEHPATLTILSNLASTLQAQGDLAGARKHQERVLELSHRVLGVAHPATSTGAWNLLITLLEQDGHEVAQEVFDVHLLWLLHRDPNDLGADQRQIRERLMAHVSQPTPSPKD